MNTCAIQSWRTRDNSRVFSLDIVRRDLSGLGLPSRRELWDVLADNEQGAERVVNWHFGSSVLWYALAADPTPEHET